jgi:hypothetical protein
MSEGTQPTETPLESAMGPAGDLESAPPRRSPDDVPAAADTATGRAAIEDEPAVEEAIRDDTTVSGLGPPTSAADDGQTPLFQEPGEEPAPPA